MTEESGTNEESERERERGDAYVIIVVASIPMKYKTDRYK